MKIKLLQENVQKQDHILVRILSYFECFIYENKTLTTSL